MSTWFDLMHTLGISVPEKTPMTPDRAATVIQSAFKKWLVRDTSISPLSPPPILPS